MQLPPMDPTAKPSTSRYSLHFLLTSPETLPPVTEFCPRQVLMPVNSWVYVLFPSRANEPNDPLRRRIPTEDYSSHRCEIARFMLR
jgi:hypothetical protein